MSAAIAVVHTVVLATVSPIRRRILPRPHLGQAWRDHSDVRLAQHRNPGCPGVLRWTDVEHAIPLAECDRCGYELGVQR